MDPRMDSGLCTSLLHPQIYEMQISKNSRRSRYILFAMIGIPLGAGALMIGGSWLEWPWMAVCVHEKVEPRTRRRK